MTKKQREAVDAAMKVISRDSSCRQCARVALAMLDDDDDIQRWSFLDRARACPRLSRDAREQAARATA